MRYAQTIAMARNLLAEGRSEDVARMIEPLVQADSDPAQSGAAMLRALLARVYVTHRGTLDAALDLLAPYEEGAARNALADAAHAEVALWLGWTYARRDETFDEEARALSLLDEAESLFSSTLDAHGRCWAHLGRARAYFTIDEYQLMRQALKEARALRRTIQDVQAKRWCYELNVAALRFQGRYDDAQSHIDALEQLGHQLGSRQVLGRAQAYQAALHLDRGDAPATIIDVAKSALSLLRDATREAASYPLLAAYHAQIQALLRQGAWDDADMLIDTAMRAVNRRPTAQAHLQTLRARLYMRRGQLEDAQRILDALCDQAPQLPHGLQRSHIALLRGELLAQNEKFDEAAVSIEQAHRNARETGHRGNELRARLTQINLELHRGHVASAREYADTLDRFDDYFGVLPFAARRFWVLGRLAEAEGDRSEAISYYKQSRSAYSLIGDLHRTARAQLRLARLGRHADPVHARPLLDAALETFERLGLDHERDAAETLQDKWPDTDSSDGLALERTLGKSLARASHSPQLVADAWIEAVSDLLPDRWIGVYEYTDDAWTSVHEIGRPPSDLSFPDPRTSEEVTDGTGWLALRRGSDGAFFMGCTLSNGDDPAWHAARQQLLSWQPVVRLALDRAVQRTDASNSTVDLIGDGAPPSVATDEIVYESASMQSLVERIQNIRSSHNPVLITGERGSGKTTIGRLVHRQSARSETPWSVVDCAGTAPGALASQLRGRVDAEPDDAAYGFLRSADGGTVLLKNIESASLDVQDTLLRILDTGDIFPKGATAPLTVDVRLLASTTENLADLVRDGQFREELWYRLNVITLHVPPLRERPTDIPVLARHFANVLRSTDTPMISITNRAMDALVEYDWPGNVRQLRNEIERALTLVSSEPAPTLDLETLSRPIRTQQSSERTDDLEAVLHPDRTLNDVLAHTEKKTIERVLAKCEGQITASADVLGLTRQGLYKKMKRLDIDASKFQPDAPSPARG